MKKVLPFEVIGIESLFACYLFDLNTIFKSLESYPVCNDKTPSVNTVKADRKQLPTEKLFSLVMIFGRHENLTFTQLEQRLVKIHRGFDFRRFPNRSFIFYAKIQRQSICDEPKSLCVSDVHLLCEVYLQSP